MTRGLDGVAWHLLTSALDMYRDHPAATDWLHHQVEVFEGPLRIAVAGPARSGKSTLINAIVGDEIAPIELGAAGQPFTSYHDGPTPQATVYPAAGPGRELAVGRVERGLRFEAPRWLAPGQEVREIVVDWPSRVLRHAILIDTPAIDPSGEAMARVRAEADAILYATPNVPDLDLRALWPDPAGVPGTPPVETILVLSRADEVGGGRIDALSSARLIGRRRDRDLAVRGLCQGAIAVSGRIGHAGRTLREAEYEALAALAGNPRPALEPYLLSVDRFTGPHFPVPLSQPARTDLLERFGLFGVRLATTLIRTGSAAHNALSAELVQRSGLTELRETISDLFVNRRAILKARSALLALRSVAATWPHPDAGRLSADVERALTAGHELRELSLLGALRAGRSSLPADRADEARRLIGGFGTGIDARLGIGADDPDPDRAWPLADELLERWRAQAQDPTSPQGQRRAAHIVVRTCEGLLTELAH